MSDPFCETDLLKSVFALIPRCFLIPAVVSLVGGIIKSLSGTRDEIDLLHPRHTIECTFVIKP